MWKVINKILWALPMALIVIALGAGAAWPKANDWIGTAFALGWSNMDRLWFVIPVLSLFAIYICLLWFSGRDRPNGNASRTPNPDMPLHAALRWIARDSVWAENYPIARDDEWVRRVDQEFRSKWKIGRIEIFGCRGDINAPIEHLVPAMKDTGEYLAHNLVSDEPPTHMWSDTFRDSNGRVIVYYRVHLDSRDIKKIWPKRSFWSKIRRKSPIERIGGYEEIFRKQDEYYFNQDGFTKTPLEAILG